MAHSVELVFDRDTEEAVRGIWDALREGGIPSQAPASRPHVTLTVAEQMDGAIDAALSPVIERLPLTCTIGAPMLFGGRVVTLVRLLIPSAELLSLHAHVYQVSLPHMPNGPLPHTGPGEWTPHVTLARRVAPDQLRAALTIKSLRRDLRARAIGVRHWDGDKREEHLIG
jgi:hypothetical protein